jgi:hypothetical protein
MDAYEIWLMGKRDSFRARANSEADRRHVQGSRQLSALRGHVKAILGGMMWNRAERPLKQASH